MRIPNEPVRFTRSVHAQPREIDVRVWQAHVLKHPFGLGALYNLGPLDGERRWNAEGWDEAGVIGREERAARVAEILALVIDGLRCGASRLDREEFRGEAPYERMPCYECRLADACEKVTRPIGDRYARELFRSFEALADSVEVRRAAFSTRVLKQARTGPPPPNAAVLSVGRLNSGVRGARISLGCGIRTELYLQGRFLLWRTTYRRRLRAPSDHVNFLTAILSPVAGLSLSDRVLVARQWWESTS